MDSYVFLLIAILANGGLVYMSGVFQTRIVRKCTTCGSSETPRRAISHVSSTILDGKRRGALHNFWKLGIQHDHILCPTCYGVALRAIYPE